MKEQEILSQVNNLKKEIMMMQLKASSDGDGSLLKERKAKKKEIARLLTKLNAKK